MTKISDLVAMTGATIDDAVDLVTVVDMSAVGAARNKKMTFAELALWLATKIAGLLDFKGSTDCSTNPNYPSALKGDYYLVSVAGKIGGASGTSVEAGDTYFATADNAGGTQASVGTSWTVVQGNTSIATAADIWTGTDNAKMLTPLGVANASAPQAVASGATITLDMNAGLNFATTLAHNTTLANPSNAAVGDSGIYVITQDGTGSRTMAYGSNWKFPGGSPVLSTAAGAIDLLSYYVSAAGVILCNLTKAYG